MRPHVRVRQGDSDLRDLVSRERGWQDGVTLLADAYAGAGKNAEAIAWLEEEAPENPRLYATLGDFYERARRWSDSANAYGIAVQRQPRNVDLKIRYGSALLNAGGRENAIKARDALSEAAAARTTDQRVLYLLSQSQRRAGDPSVAEATARRLIAINKTSPWGYYALAEALQDRQQYQAIVVALGPVLGDLRSRAADVPGLALLLHTSASAYEQLGQYDAAIAAFDEAHRLDPSDGLVTAYLIQATLSAKKFGAAAASRRRPASERTISGWRGCTRRRFGRTASRTRRSRSSRVSWPGSPIVRLCMSRSRSCIRNESCDRRRQDARSGAGEFPAETAIPFELARCWKSKKRFADAEAAFRQVLAD